MSRLDKWLWAARIFKTRPLASKAITGGHVAVNGGRAKPARSIRTGDVVTVRKGPYIHELIVEGISDRRGPATVAKTLYTETPDSIRERERLAGELKTRAAQIMYDTVKPDRREQRQARMRKRAQ